MCAEKDVIGSAGHISVSEATRYGNTLWEDSLEKQEVADRKRTTFLDMDTHTQTKNRKKNRLAWGFSLGVGI